MKIAVIGAGSVGTTLGDRLSASGHEVRYGTRTPESEKTVKMLSERPEGVKASLIEDACTWSDAIILAVPGMSDEREVQATVVTLGVGVNGKVVIDATNPLSAWPKLELPWAGASSTGEMLQIALPTSHVYKAFNTVGVEHMADPSGKLVKLPYKETMLYVGNGGENDPNTKIAGEIVAGVGFQPVYAGPIRYSRNLEAIAELWIHMAVFGTGEEKFKSRMFHFQTVYPTE